MRSRIVSIFGTHYADHRFDVGTAIFAAYQLRDGHDDIVIEPAGLTNPDLDLAGFLRKGKPARGEWVRETVHIYNPVPKTKTLGLTKGIKDARSRQRC
ncbi:hypothetical protein [Mesorhizobium mediterraneum]|uniref:hypothetical protein n=1 Tax=Mesorhizobium mediterraneum TaxID=43617 RepID=UPI0017844D94|nr:hypothetical protein [Mesorhizobium mediterraneum]